MSYPVLSVALGVSVLAFIGILILVRRRFPGDYTPLKVIVGVGLVEVARWLHATEAGLSATFQMEQFGLMALAGGLICIWQVVEWLYRQYERLDRRITEACDGRTPPTRGGGSA